MAFTEDLLLPSRGIIYEISDFDGVVKVKPFTTKSYKDLLAGNASENAIRQFIDSCLVDCPIKAKNMNQNDLMAVLFKTRALTLGNMLKMQISCPRCHKITEVEWDLNEVTVNYLSAEEYPIKVTLPDSGKEIKVRFPTGATTAKAKIEAERRSSKFNKPVSEYLNIFNLVSILDVESKDLVEKSEWYENLSPRDAIYIDAVISEMGDIFGVEMFRDETCLDCGKTFTSVIDLSADFFRPYSVKRLGLKGKAGNLAGIIKESSVSE